MSAGNVPGGINHGGLSSEHEVGIAVAEALPHSVQTQLSYLDAIRALHVSEIEIDGMLLTVSLQSIPSGIHAEQ